MSDDTRSSNNRHIRFSHDQGQADQYFPAQGMNSPTNNVAHNPPPAVLAQRESMSLEDMYSDGTNYSVPSRPQPATTHGSGLPERGLDRPGTDNVAPSYTNPFDIPSYPSTAPLRVNQQPGLTRGRYGSSSEETLVGEQQAPPLKPALRRSSTEEHLRQQAAREASDLVNSHVDGRRPHDNRPVPQRGEGWEDDLPEDWQSQQRAAAGILSNLLRLYGNGQGPVAGMNRGMTQGSHSSTGSYYGDRDQDLRRRSRRTGEADEGAYPRGSNTNRMRRGESTNTVGTSFEDKVIDPDDPRSKIGPGMEKWYESEAIKLAKEAHDKAAKEGDELGSLDAAEHRDAIEGRERKKNKYKKLKHKNSITAHVATLIQKQDFILKLAKALMTFGAPSHRLESQLNATSAVLGVNAQFIHVPSVVIASFGDSDTHTSETKFIKASGGLNLGQLHRIHLIYREVVHDEMGVEEGIVALDRCLKSKPIYPNWLRVVFAGMCAGIICPMGFAGSIIDALVAGTFGATLCFLQLYVARKNAVFSNIFEISVAALISFAARGLSTTNYFCYESVASAGVVMVLPGYVVLCGSLELASKNLIAGSVRMVYAIIYTLFLGFSIAVGSDVFYLFDPSSRQVAASQHPSVMTLDGTFIANNVSQSFEGSFSFTNQTQTIVSQTTASLQKGSIMCYRDSAWPWWRQGASIYWLILLVPAFSFFSSLANMQPLRSRELPVMIFIAVVGYVANRAATMFIFERSDIVSFIGATVIGLLGNLYSRLFNGTSFTAMATGVLFLVPGGIAAAGGLAMSQGGSNSYNSGLMIGFRMVQVAIGITIGLFFASFLVYSVGTKKRGGGLGFAF
ncbi:uncharacterized protein JCM15063_001023 [Sporobolomyces koalae]|uniref:uncharacterized protein n=1 Tax=Sporobolomyces koalae TaxID=500713 RepID=UPI00317FB48C